MAEPSAKRIKLELQTKLNYRNGLFLAPMVRCGTLPTRLLSLDYGASLVWGACLSGTSYTSGPRRHS